MKKKLIIINGTMGVGKTTISSELNKELSNSIWLDGDWCWNMDPFIVNKETKAIVIDNITHILRNYISISHIEHIIFNWVIDINEIFDLILNPLKDLEVEVIKITLTCSKETLVNRISKDIKSGKREKDSINKSLKRVKLYDKLNTIKINTDNKSVQECVQDIIKLM